MPQRLTFGGASRGAPPSLLRGGPSIPGPSVSPTLVLSLLVLLAGAVLLAEWLASSLEAEFVGSARDITWWDIGYSALEHGLILVAVLLTARLAWGRVRASDFGLGHLASSALATGAVVYGGFVVCAALLFALVGAPPLRESASALADADSTSVVVAYGVIALVVVPPTEELLFRGLLFPAVRRRLALAPAAVVAGCLFGALHGPPLGSMADLALLGIALCVLYALTASLVACIAVHAVHNGIAFGAVVSLSAPATLAVTALGAVAAVAATRALARAMRE